MVLGLLAALSLCPGPASAAGSGAPGWVLYEPAAPRARAEYTVEVADLGKAERRVAKMLKRYKAKPAGAPSRGPDGAVILSYELPAASSEDSAVLTAEIQDKLSEIGDVLDYRFGTPSLPEGVSDVMPVRVRLTLRRKPKGAL